MLPSCQIFALLLATVVLSGCAHTSSEGESKPLTASATSTIDSNGNVITRKATPEEAARLGDKRRRADAVNKRFPRAAAPAGVPLIKGAQMLPTGELVLSDGRIAIMDGVRCTSQGYEYLSRLFLDPEASLLVVETGPAVSGRVPAVVWVVEPLGSATATHFPVEAGVSSGWCDAARSATFPYNDRFAALEAAFEIERSAYKASAP